MSEDCHRKDVSLFKEFLVRHERMLRWQCLKCAYGDPDRADDYFQDVVLSLWRYLPALPLELPPKEERAYVKRAARLALSKCRRKRRPDLRRLQVELADTLDSRRREGEELLNTLSGSLPEKYGEVVRLYRTGFNTSEIAQILGIGEEVVRQRIHRATVKMREMYEKECRTIKHIHHGQRRDDIADA